LLNLIFLFQRLIQGHGLEATEDIDHFCRVVQ
jgi:hypothetical protein